MFTSMTDLSPSMSLPAGDFLLCTQDPARPGISIDNFESGFAEGEAVFSELSLVEANDQMTKTLKDVTTITSSVGTLAALAFPPAAAVSGALTAITGLISLFTGGVSSNDAFIANGFNQMNRKMDELSLQISQGFLDVRKDVADNELDDLMGYLQSIHNAYQDMVDASLDNTTSDDTREVYAQKYRAVCNHPFFTPNDLFRQFYGFACGDNPNRQCATDGDNTGTCKYGVKKRQYIRDIYEGIAEGLSSRFIPFGTWLLKAMVLAQFHFEACLPQDELSCNDPVIDPVRKVTAEEMKNATAEVEFNLNYTLNCTFDKFRDTLSDNNFYQTQVPGMNDCLNMKDSEDGSKDAPPENKNKCMATKTREKLNAEFPTKHWAVVVYNEEGTAPDGRAIVIDQCDRGLDYGCMNNNIQELGGRSFHLMYREKSKGRKNYIVNPLGDVVGVLGGLGLDLPNLLFDRPEDSVVTSEDADVFDGTKLGLAVYGVVDKCLGDPLNPSNDPTGHIALLRREHGYIAIRTGNGTPRGADYDPDIFRGYDLHYSEIETSNPECNMPAFKLHNCIRPTGFEEAASNIIPNDPIGIGDQVEGAINGADTSNSECAHIDIIA